MIALLHPAPPTLGNLGEILVAALARHHPPHVVAWEIDFLRREQLRGDHSEATALALGNWRAIRAKQREIFADMEAA